LFFHPRVVFFPERHDGSDQIIRALHGNGLLDESLENFAIVNGHEYRGSVRVNQPAYAKLGAAEVPHDHTEAVRDLF
jgi:hypothetical protein